MGVYYFVRKKVTPGLGCEEFAPLCFSVKHRFVRDSALFVFLHVCIKTFGMDAINKYIHIQKTLEISINHYYYYPV